MISKNEPYLIEYNVRMGDPECQTILPKLKSDLIDIILSCCDKSLNKQNLEWVNKKSLCVVLCSKGYPESFLKNVEIKQLDKLDLQENDFLFHAGTLKKNEKIFSNGGRVLNLVSISNDFSSARKKIVKNLEKINWTNGYYRRDIGYKVID